MMIMMVVVEVMVVESLYDGDGVGDHKDDLNVGDNVDVDDDDDDDADADDSGLTTCRSSRPTRGYSSREHNRGYSSKRAHQGVLEQRRVQKRGDERGGGEEES
jgi:hypothetical protein